MQPEHYLLTGFPGQVARGLLERILSSEAEARVVVLTPASCSQRAGKLLGELEAARRQRVTVLEGDAWAIDFGLSALEYRTLLERITRVHHVATETSPTADEASAERINIGGARELIQFGRDSTVLRRIVLHSTAMVSGTRTGLVREDELEAGQRFRCAAEQTLARAERMLHQHAQELPFTVLRPTHIVGDSRTGAIERLGGIYSLVSLLLSYPPEWPVPLSLARRGEVLLHVVPVDFVVEAAHALGRLDCAVGRTFHVADPTPPSAREAFDLLANHTGRRWARRLVPAEVARGALDLPGVRRLTGSPRAVLDLVVHAVRYDTANTERALARTGIHCPPFQSYCTLMVAQVRARSDRGAAT
ncbi:MAG: SDR family oxidoreductase [Polyangiaceae bacterium]|nr:SDR family oxidoreductase [Polyangiaceae bacterium]